MHFGFWQIAVIVGLILSYISHVQKAKRDPNPPVKNARLGYAIGGLVGYGVFLFILVKAGTFH
jgi:hypothetical protein